VFPPVAARVSGLSYWHADWYVPSSHQTRALGFKVIPVYGLHLVVHYRTPMRSIWQFGPRIYRQFGQRHFATALQTGVATLLPRGPLGMISPT